MLDIARVVNIHPESNMVDVEVQAEDWEEVI